MPIIRRELISFRYGRVSSRDLVLSTTRSAIYITNTNFYVLLVPNRFRREHTRSADYLEFTRRRSVDRQCDILLLA